MLEKGLYKIFADKWIHNGSVYFYSDPHFADDEMKYLRKNYIGDDAQVAAINKVIGKHDTIIFLGDIGDVEIIKRIRGYKVLVMGNHDKGATNYLDYFDEVYEGALMISDKIILSHEPILNLPSFMFNIHGHDHAGTYLGKHYLNVCAENIDYTPVRLKSLIEKGIFKDVDNIHRVAIDNAIVRKAKRRK